MVAPAAATTDPLSTSTSSIAVSLRRLRSTAPPRGMPPPTSPVLPPWGTIGTRAARQRAHDLGDLLDASRTDDRARLAAVPARPVGLVAGPQLRIGEDVRLADDVREGLDDRRRVHPAHRRAARGRSLIAPAIRSAP